MARELAVISVSDHPRGKVYELSVEGGTVSLLFTFHSLQRGFRWGLTQDTLLESIVFPEEVLRGHRGRFIAHRRYGDHVVRIVYEYDGPLPIVITVYYPYTSRYFKGGGVYEDRVFP